MTENNENIEKDQTGNSQTKDRLEPGIYLFEDDTFKKFKTGHETNPKETQYPALGGSEKFAAK